MKITIEPAFAFKSGITSYRLTCKTEFGGRGGSKVILDNNIYSKEPLDLKKFKKLLAANGIEGLDDLFCDGDCIKEDSEVFTKMNNFLVDYSNPINDEQNKQPFAWDMEFVKQVRKTENGGLYAFYVVLEKGSRACKIPYYSYADDGNGVETIIDFVDGKIVKICGQELAKRIIESRVKDLIKGKDNYDEIVRILTADTKENTARFQK